LFEVKSNPQLNKESFVFNENGKYPYFTRTIFNNGIFGYVNYLDDEHRIDGNCLAVGMMAMKFFYMNKDFYAGQFTKRIIALNFELNEKIANFLITILNKKQDIFKNVLVRDFEKTFNKEIIQLPTKNNKIDFDFIENFIDELEKAKINQIKEYLKQNNLDNYNLTKKEKEILEKFKKEEVEWEEFEIGELFEKIKFKKLNYKTSELPNEPNKIYSLPVLTAGIENQGLNNFVPRDEATILKNVISISANGANTGVTFYQSKEFTILQDAYSIDFKNKDKNLNDNHYLFFTTAILKSIYGNYDYTNKAGWEKVKKERIQLPINNDEIDFDFMKNLISAIQKSVIKKVVLYVNKKIKNEL